MHIVPRVLPNRIVDPPLIMLNLLASMTEKPEDKLRASVEFVFRCLFDEDCGEFLEIREAEKYFRSLSFEGATMLVMKVMQLFDVVRAETDMEENLKPFDDFMKGMLNDDE